MQKSKHSSPVHSCLEILPDQHLQVAGRRVRLWGVDAPEKAQRCLDAQGSAYACGALQTEALSSLDSMEHQ